MPEVKPPANVVVETAVIPEKEGKTENEVLPVSQPQEASKKTETVPEKVG